MLKRITLLLCWGVAACQHPPETQLISGPSMGSHYSVKIAQLPDGVALSQLQKEVQALLDAIEQVASTWREDSELSRFNQSAAGAFPASTTLRELMALSLRACVETGGALDVTVGPLVNLWGFGPSSVPEHKPTLEQLQQARQRVGCQHLKLQDDAVVKDADIYVDLSSVTQGYAGGKVADLLDAKGVQSYLVDLSGELISKGRKADGSDWRIAVEVPQMGKLLPGGGVESIQKVITLKGKAVATSGDYRNFVEIDGERVTHIIDPMTGAPVTHNLASVTVLDDDVAWADAMSTAIMVMGPEKGLAFASTRNMPVLLVIRTDAGFEEKMTPAFAPFVQPL